jgi:hypothetical protein
VVAVIPPEFFAPQYSLFELLGAIVLAALPMSRIAETLLLLFLRRVGLKDSTARRIAEGDAEESGEHEQ